MKRSLLYLMVAACLLASCDRSVKFTVNGTLIDTVFPPKVDSVGIDAECPTAMVKAAVVDNQYTVKGRVKKASLARIYPIGKQIDAKSRMLILEKGTITFKAGKPCGTPLNDANNEFIARLQEISKQNVKNPEEMKRLTEKEFTAFVSQHKDDPCSVFAVMISEKKLDPQFVLDLIKTLSPEMRDAREVHQVRNHLKRLLKHATQE